MVIIKVKKFILIVSVILLITFGAVACGGEPGVSEIPGTLPSGNNPTTGNEGSQNNNPTGSDNNITPGTNGDNGTPSAANAFFPVIRDVEIHLNENIENIIAQLGEPLATLTAPSCAFDGDDIIFKYHNFELYTYPVGENNFIYIIVFTDDTIRTNEGRIRLGSSLQSVLDAYGKDFVHEMGLYKFSRGDTMLEFLISDDDDVIGLTYRLNIENLIG